MSEVTSRLVRLEVTDDIGTIDPARWDALMARCDAPVFYRHDFLSAYQHSNLGAATAIRYLTCSAGSAASPPELVGALPAYLVDGAEVGRVFGIERLACRTTPLLMSHLPHCYDTTVPILSADPGLVRLLSDGLRELGRSLGAGVIGLLNVADDRRAAAEIRGLPGVTALPGTPRWCLDLTSR